MPDLFLTTWKFLVLKYLLPDPINKNRNKLSKNLWKITITEKKRAEETHDKADGGWLAKALVEILKTTFDITCTLQFSFEVQTYANYIPAETTSSANLYPSTNPYSENFF